MPANAINLLSRTDFDKTPVGKFLRWSLTYGRYIIVCTEIIVLVAFIYRFSLDRRITDLNEEIEQKSAIIQANQEFENQFRNLQKRTQEIGKLFINQDIGYKLMQHLQQITPQGATYIRMSVEENAVSINGTADSNSSFALFLNQLNNSPYLTNIDIRSLSKKTATTGEIEFELGMSVKEDITQAGSITQ